MKASNLTIAALSILWSGLTLGQEAFIKKNKASGDQPKHFQAFDFANHGKARWINDVCENLANKRPIFAAKNVDTPLEENECIALNPEVDPVPSARATADAQLFENVTVGELTGKEAKKYDNYLRSVERIYRKEARIIRLNNILANEEATAKQKEKASKRLVQVETNLQKNINNVTQIKTSLIESGSVTEETFQDCTEAGIAHEESVTSTYFQAEVEFYQTCSEQTIDITLTCNDGTVEGDLSDLVGDVAECQVKDAPYVATEFALFGPGPINPKSPETTLTDFASNVDTNDIIWKDGECRYLKFNYPYRLYSYTDLLDGAPLNPEDATVVGEEACEIMISLMPQ